MVLAPSKLLLERSLEIGNADCGVSEGDGVGGAEVSSPLTDIDNGDKSRADKRENKADLGIALDTEAGDDGKGEDEDGQVG